MKKEINVKTSSSHRGDYYPFGMTIPGSEETTAFENKNLYNSKELMDEHNLNIYDYGARYYDPQLGKWWQVDPADKLDSPYVYCANNPIMYIDPDGNKIKIVHENDENHVYSTNGGIDGNMKYIGRVVVDYDVSEDITPEDDYTIERLGDISEGYKYLSLNSIVREDEKYELTQLAVITVSLAVSLTSDIMGLSAIKNIGVYISIANIMYGGFQGIKKCKINRSS